ncbi:hypothetical protein N0V90_011429 [Kalmusia sp. IMI 367209]|nr:hypothetical protein N0V90_011429 [Kalmusia sp. IMI 367209]
MFRSLHAEDMTEEDTITPVSPTPTYVASFPETSTLPAEKTSRSCPPFDHNRQLCVDLEYSTEGFLRSLTTEQRLPDAPTIPLDSRSIIAYSLQDLDTPSLNKLNKKLWWAGANPTVKSLGNQLTFERRIVITEDPSLHLVISENRIVYIKPLPAYLCSHAYWQHLLDDSNTTVDPEDRRRLLATSLGFLKTYAALITHRSDYTTALRHNLLPPCPSMTFESLVAFTHAFAHVPSSAVSPRWRYGELLLDALNFHSGIFLHRYHFNRFESNHGVYFQRFFPVTLFLFASFSVILSAMQVIISGRQIWETENRGLKRALGVFEWFGVEVIAWSLAFGGMFFVWWIFMAVLEGWKMRRVRRGCERGWKEERKVGA